MNAAPPLQDEPRYQQGGFALVTTLALLAMLVLAVFALSALSKTNSRLASASLRHMQARQNALLALDLAVGELQRHAGPDNRRTGMAGVAGIEPGNSFRQWLGVWGGAQSPVWLVSGSGSSITPALGGSRLVIVGPHSVGTLVDRKDQELVEVGLIELPGLSVEGLASSTGRIGYWVGDEGVKVSAIVAAAELNYFGVRGIRPNLQRLVSPSFGSEESKDPRVISIEQLKEATTGFSLFKSFHSLSRTHWALESTASGGAVPHGNYVAGAFNVNTTSESAWRALLEFPDLSNPEFGLDAVRSLSVARRIGELVAARNTPFETINDFRDSNIIQQAFDSASPKVTTVTQDDFFDVWASMLVTRSDTFRIRGYGDTINAADPLEISASAYCEAIVQRTPEGAPGGMGRRFVVIYFRWLGPDDI